MNNLTTEAQGVFTETGLTPRQLALELATTRASLNALQLLSENRRQELRELAEQKKELLEALDKAKEIIAIWHGEVAWPEYQHSPEMKQINAALALK